MALKIIIPGNPVPSPRPRFRNAGKFVQTYMPSTYMKEKKRIAAGVKNMIKDFEINEKALEMNIIFYMPIPKSLSVKKTVEIDGKCHQKKPDLDNLLKTYKDALEGVIYKNDSQIAIVNMHKAYSTNPRVELEIKEVF